MSLVFNPFTSNFDTVSDLTVTVGSSSNVNASSVSQAGSSIALTLEPANTSFPGILTATDWNTFNNKQPAGNYITALTGDVTATGPGSAAATLATVNSNVGSFTYASLTVNAKGLITAASSGAAPVTTLGPVGSAPNANAGLITGNTLVLEPFDATHPGVVTASAGGTANFLRADGTWATPPGTGVTAVSVVSANGLAGTSSGGATPALTLSTTVTGLLKGNGTAISAATSADLPTITLTGDVTGAAAGGSIPTTLATVNSNVGSFTNASITVNAKGLITAASNGAGAGVTPTIQKFLSTGTITGYLFTISTSTTCAAGDTYTNNGNTYTVLGALTAQTGNVFFTSGVGTPTASGTLTRATGSGTTSITFTISKALGTYTTPTSPAPLYIKVELVGGGGGGGGSYNQSASPGTAAGNGTDTVFGVNLIKGNGAGTNGGSSSISSPAIGYAQVGSNGAGVMDTISATAMYSAPSGVGPFGGAAGFGGGGSPGVAAPANSGSGGTGGSASGAARQVVGSSGGAGGFASAIIPAPTTNYVYAVGTGGSAGGAGTGGVIGGAGGSGVIIVTEYYN